MTSLPATLLTAKGLAASREFANGAWRDAQGRDLFDALEAALGSHEQATNLWRAACDLFETRGYAEAACSPAVPHQPRSLDHFGVHGGVR